MADREQDASRENLPFQTVEGPSSTWVEIATAASEEEANLLRGFLENQGIPCQVESLRSEELPVNFGKLGEIRIYVNSENETSALALLAEQSRQYESLAPEGSVITDEGPAVIADDAQTVTEDEG